MTDPPGTRGSAWVGQGNAIYRRHPAQSEKGKRGKRKEERGERGQCNAHIHNVGSGKRAKKPTGIRTGYRKTQWQNRGRSLYRCRSADVIGEGKKRIMRFLMKNDFSKSGKYRKIFGDYVYFLEKQESIALRLLRVVLLKEFFSVNNRVSKENFYIKGVFDLILTL